MTKARSALIDSFLCFPKTRSFLSFLSASLISSTLVAHLFPPSSSLTQQKENGVGWMRRSVLFFTASLSSLLERARLALQARSTLPLLSFLQQCSSFFFVHFVSLFRRLSMRELRRFSKLSLIVRIASAAVPKPLPPAAPPLERISRMSTRTSLALHRFGELPLLALAAAVGRASAESK
jgi:hypothetical protein